jgi:hypothetical protein
MVTSRGNGQYGQCYRQYDSWATQARLLSCAVRNANGTVNNSKRRISRKTASERRPPSLTVLASIELSAGYFLAANWHWGGGATREGSTHARLLGSAVNRLSGAARRWSFD